MLNFKGYKIVEICNSFCVEILYEYNGFNYSTCNLKFITEMLGMDKEEMIEILASFNGLNSRMDICFKNRKDIENFAIMYLDPIIMVNKLLMSD